MLEYCDYLKLSRGDYAISNNIAFLRKLWLIAKKKHLADDIPNPFGGLSLKLNSDKKKEHLTFDERQLLLDALEGDQLTKIQKRLLRPFLIGCYSSLRHSDWSQCKNIVNGEIQVYQTKKGGKSKPRKSLLYIPVVPGSTLEKLLSDLPDDFKVTMRGYIN